MASGAVEGGLGAPGRRLMTGPREVDSPGFFGRGPEITALGEAIRSARLGNGSTWLITGPPGIGKSALLDYLAQKGVSEGFELRRGRAELHRTDAFRPWRSIFTEEPGPDLTPDGAADPGGRRRRYPDGGAPPAPPSELVLLEYVGQLETATARHPLMILLDDFQWADPESVAALELLARKIGNLRGLLVAGIQDPATPDAPVPAEGLSEPFARLQREESVRWLPLAPLSEEATRRLVDRLLPPTGPGRDRADPIDRLVRDSKGNPFRAIEFAISRRHRSDPAPPPTELPPRPGSDAPPATDHAELWDSIRRRLRELPAAEQNFLGSAAVLGPTFELAPLSAALGQRPRAARELARNLVVRGWLTVDDGGAGERYRFVHELTWRGTRESTPKQYLRRSAAQQARWFGRVRPGELATRARLVYAAGRVPEARRLLRVAIERSVADRELGPLPTYLRWHHAMDSSPAARRESARLYLEVLHELRFGGGHGFERILLDLHGMAPNPEERLAAELWGFDRLAARTPAELEPRLVELEGRIEGLSRAAGRRLRTRLAFLRAVYAQLTAPPEEVLRRAEEALAGCLAKGWAMERCRLRLAAAWALRELGRPAEARRMLERAKRDARQSGPSRELLDVMIEEVRCGLKEADGDLGACLRDRESLSRRYRGAGFLGPYASSLFNLAGIQADLGDLEGAWRNASESRRIAEGLELGFISGMAGMAQAQVLLDEGWPGEALPRIRHAIESVRSPFAGADSTVFAWVAENQLVRCLAETDALPEARARSEELRRQLKGRGPLLAAPFELTRARVLERSGDLEASRRAALRALELSREVAQPRLRMEILGYLVRWEALHGDTRQARKREEELKQECRGAGADPSGILRNVEQAVARERRRTMAPPERGAESG